MVRTSRHRLEMSGSAFVVACGEGGVLPAGRGDSQSATTTREELRSVLNCSFEDMLMTDMVGVGGGRVGGGRCGVLLKWLICHHARGLLDQRPATRELSNLESWKSLNIFEYTIYIMLSHTF